MATTIEQKPLYDNFVVGQDVIFSVSNTPIVSGFTGVKIIAEVFISNGFPPNPSVNTHLVGTFKTTPNNVGVGMFNFRPIIESFVSADNIARLGSAYKLSVTTADTNVPIHLIDRYSGNKNIIRYLAVKFKTEYVNSSGEIVLDGTTDVTSAFRVINGYLKYTDGLQLSGVNFGYNLVNFELSSNTNIFLSNAPLTQYANLNDYGTIPILVLNGNCHANSTIFLSKNGALDSNETAILALSTFARMSSGKYDIESLSIICSSGRKKSMFVFKSFIPWPLFITTSKEFSQ